MLRLYDSTDCFATYSYLASEEKGNAMWSKLQDLHIAINESEKRVVESKITALYDELV
jgi:hypothetical protein